MAAGTQLALRWLCRPRAASRCEQCYLFPDLCEWRPGRAERSLPPSLLPPQACEEVPTGLVSWHPCLGYPATAGTSEASARLMALGSWPRRLKCC